MDAYALRANFAGVSFGTLNSLFTLGAGFALFARRPMPRAERIMRIRLIRMLQRWSITDSMRALCTISPQHYFVRMHVEYEDGTEAYSDILRYSVESYAANIIRNHRPTDTIRAAMENMMKYGDAASAYFAYAG